MPYTTLALRSPPIALDRPMFYSTIAPIATAHTSPAIAEDGGLKYAV